MKQLLQQYAAYNIWAHKKMIHTINQLPESIIHKEILSSFPSVYKTMLHLWDVEAIWWQRLKLAERVQWPSKSFEGGISEINDSLIIASQEWDQWIRMSNDIQLKHVFAYQNSKKEQFKQPVYEMLLHLFNHQTYHRGQLVTMLHELGLDKIPSSDFIEFSRKK